jgi:thymidylate synthase
VQVEGASGSAVYLELLKAVLRYGMPVAPRGQSTSEILDVQVIIEDPAQVHVLETSRHPRASIVATEAAHLIAGVSSLEQLDMASGGRFSQFADKGRLRGAYGPRVCRQLERVVSALSDDPDSRQAMATVWLGDELSAASSDMPCTTTMHFLVRDGKLRMRVTMRSNDAFLGFPIDIEFFSALQRTVAAALRIPPGAYSHSVSSFHLYDRDRARVQGIVNAGFTESYREPVLKDGALPHATDLSPLQRWRSTRESVEDVIFWRDEKAREAGGWRDWQLALAEGVPHLDEKRGFTICMKCRYITGTGSPSRERSGFLCEECSGEMLR